VPVAVRWLARAGPQPVPVPVPGLRQARVPERRLALQPEPVPRQGPALAGELQPGPEQVPALAPQQVPEPEPSRVLEPVPGP